MRTSLKTLTFILALAGVVGSAELLLGSTPDTGGKPWDPVDGASPVSVSTSHKCRIETIDPQTRTIVVFDEASQQLQKLKIDDKLSVVAQSKKQFDGRKKLRFEDFVVGQRLKVTMLTKDGSVARIKVLKDSGSPVKRG